MKFRFLTYAELIEKHKAEAAQRAAEQFLSRPGPSRNPSGVDNQGDAQVVEDAPPALPAPGGSGLDRGELRVDGAQLPPVDP
jgi:hypothetical protein